MKLFLIAALLVFALTHGSSAQDGGAQMSEYLENLKAKIHKDIHDFVNKPELKDHAESFIEDRQTELEPLVAKIPGQLEDLKVVATNIQEHIKPLAANVKETVNPLIHSLQQKIDSILQTLAEDATSRRR